MYSSPTPAGVPVVLITGVDPDPITRVTMALQWDLPSAAIVRHDVDPERVVLARTVADLTGVVERQELDVWDVCSACATREDLVETLERLAASGRWAALVVALPIGFDPRPLCRQLSREPDAAPHVRLAALVAALEGASAVADLVGDDLLVERHLPVPEDDERGVGETLAASVEYADLIAVTGTPTVQGRHLIDALARPDAEVRTDATASDLTGLLTGHHRSEAAEDWSSPVCDAVLPPLPDAAAREGVWRLDVASDRPFHPERLHAYVEALGRGARRARGCFWLPTRPGRICQWDGAGGMVSIGILGDWGADQPLTRIIVTGTDAGRDDLEAAFRACLLTDAELAERGRFWETDEDGLEPWLGPIRRKVEVA